MLHSQLGTKLFAFVLFIWTISATLGAPLEDNSNVTDPDYGMVNDGFAKSRLGFNTAFSLGDNPDPPAESPSSSGTRHHHGGGRRVKMSCDPTPQRTLRRWMGPAFNARYMSVNKPSARAPLALGGSPMTWGLSDQGIKSEPEVDEKTADMYAWGLSDLPSDPLSPDYQEDKDDKGDKDYKEDYPGGDMMSDYQGDQPAEDEDAFHDVVRGEFAVDKDFRRDLPEDTDEIHGQDETEGWMKKNNQGALEPFLRRAKRSLGSRGLLKSSSLLKKKPPSSISSGKKKPFSTGLVAKNPKQEEWKCSQKVIWVDLGADHFPRYVRSVTCSQTRCWFGNYGCKEKSFTIKVLRRVSDECKPVYAKGAKPDSEPIGYHQEWVFEERALPFCCECGRLDL